MARRRSDPPRIKNTLFIGEINADLVLSGVHSAPEFGQEMLIDDFNVELGGSTALCAAGLAQLGNAVGYVGKVGTDVMGRFCVDAMLHRRIDMSHVTQDPALKTGITVALSNSEDRALVTYPGSIGTLAPVDVPVRCFSRYDHLHVSSFYLQTNLRPQLHELFAYARSRGLSTSLDPGFDPLGHWGDVLPALQHVDLFFPNEVELRALTGLSDPAQSLRRLGNGRTNIIAKLGARGCMALIDGEFLQHPAFTVEVRDTTGAGDSFDAGFLHAWLMGHSPADCLTVASACGALSTLKPGGSKGQPTARELQSFLRKQRRSSQPPPPEPFAEARAVVSCSST